MSPRPGAGEGGHGGWARGRQPGAACRRPYEAEVSDGRGRAGGRCSRGQGRLDPESVATKPSAGRTSPRPGVRGPNPAVAEAGINSGRVRSRWRTNPKPTPDQPAPGNRQPRSHRPISPRPAAHRPETNPRPARHRRQPNPGSAARHPEPDDRYVPKPAPDRPATGDERAPDQQARPRARPWTRAEANPGPVLTGGRRTPDRPPSPRARRRNAFRGQRRIRPRSVAVATAAVRESTASLV